MIPDHANHYDDWDLFAIGALEEGEQREMAAHLASGCERCNAEYSAALAVAAGLASLSPEEKLPVGAEARLRQRLGAGSEAPAPLLSAAVAAKPRIWAVAPWGFAAALLIVVVFLAGSLGKARRDLAEQQRQDAANRQPLQPEPAARLKELQTATEELKSELASAQSAKLQAEQGRRDAELQLSQVQARLRDLEVQLKSAEAQRSQLEEALSRTRLQLAKAESDATRIHEMTSQNDQIIALLESAPLSQLDLKPAGGAKAAARVFWQDDFGLLLVARDLPPLSPGGSFQLWFYEKDSTSLPVNVGVVQMRNTGRGLLFVPSGPALRSMAGALLTEEVETKGVSVPGREILKVKP